MRFFKRFSDRTSRKETDFPPVRYESEQNPDFCPRCGAPTIASIQYGFPVWSDELKKKIKNKQVVLGGCISATSNPLWKCTSCELLIHKPDDSE